MKNMRTFLILTWILLFVYLSFDFIYKAHENFVQFSFDWSQQETLKTFQKVSLDSISHDYLAISSNYESFSDLDKNDSFKLTTGNNVYYYRATSILFEDTQTQFKGIVWINNIPNKQSVEGMLEVIKLPLKQSGKKAFTTIGDSQIIWSWAKEFRKKLAKKEDVIFYGTEKDVYNYPFVGGVFTKTSTLVEDVKQMERTPNYILFFGAQDKAVNFEDLKINIKKLIDYISTKPITEKIFWISLPPSHQPKFQKYNHKFNAIIRECAAENELIILIDSDTIFKNEQDYLWEDGVHLNEKGYDMILRELRNKI